MMMMTMIWWWWWWWFKWWWRLWWSGMSMVMTMAMMMMATTVTMMTGELTELLSGCMCIPGCLGSARSPDCLLHSSWSSTLCSWSDKSADWTSRLWHWSGRQHQEISNGKYVATPACLSSRIWIWGLPRESTQAVYCNCSITPKTIQVFKTIT